MVLVDFLCYQIICMLSGDVAQLCRQTQSLLAPPAALTIRQVYSILQKIRYACPNYGTVLLENTIIHLLVLGLIELHSTLR